MSRTLAELPSGTRLTDHISLGVVTKAIPKEVIDAVLEETGRRSRRRRRLPAREMVYYAIALAFYMEVSTGEVLRCLLEGLRWLSWPDGGAVPVTGKSGISQARSRLGEAPLRALYRKLVVPQAVRGTKGPGIAAGGWSPWTAPRWMWRTRPTTRRPSGGRALRAARAVIPSCAS